MSRFQFSRNGKQLLCNGCHLADCVNESWASVLVAMLNRDANRVGDDAIDKEFR